MNHSLPTPILDENTKEQSASLAVPGPGLRSSALSYIDYTVISLFMTANWERNGYTKTFLLLL